ncbi:Abi-alpha family protein [Vibrio sp. 10N.261.51.A3]|uniref:Abi-alpha family protein n=1 Tax=Vibrio sp. 10N.261.51.A3 TaxID=3229673 RepID=UPI00354DB0F2
MSDKEISVTKDGFVLKGDVVDAITVPIATICRTADSILRVGENLVGLPADYLENKLVTFRTTFSEGYKKIPKNRRIEPSLRTGCIVLKNVSYAAEEQDIQKLFGQLLVSASDSELADFIHPSYASVINDMSAIDAHVLDCVFGGKVEKKPNTSEDNIQKSLSNLTRLGLIEFREKNSAKNPNDYWVRSLTLYGEDFIKVVLQTED